MKYPAKVLIAWSEAIKGNKQIREWLMKNGYEELGIFVHALNNDDESREWLMTNKYPHLMAVINGAEGNKQALGWLENYKLLPLMHVARSGDGNEDSFKWLIANGHRELALVAKQIQVVKDRIEQDNQDMHKISKN